MAAGQMSFQTHGYEDPTRSLQHAFGAGSIFSRTLDRIDAQQSENARLKLMQDREERDRKQDVLRSNLAIDSANREQSRFDTEQNTLRATSEGATTLDKAAVGKALLDRQASDINKSLDTRIASLAAQNKMSVDDFTASGALQKAVESGAFKDLTGVTGTGHENVDKASGGSMGRSAEHILAANQGNLKTQKQLIAETGDDFFKATPAGAEEMLYDPSKLLAYKQGLLNNIDSRLEKQADRDQQGAMERARLAQSERHYRQSRADSKKAISDAEAKEAARLETFGKSLIPAEKQTHKVYTKEFGEKILNPIKKLEEIKTKREEEAISEFSKDNVFKKSGLSIVNVSGKPTIVNPSGKPMSSYYISEQQKKLDDAVFKKVAPDVGGGTLYTRIANLKKIAMDADNPIHQQTYGYKFTGKKVGRDNLDGLVMLSNGNYKSSKPDYIKHPNEYSALMTQMAINGINQFGDPASPDDIMMARLWLLNEQNANTELSRKLTADNVNTVNTNLKPPKPKAED